MTSLKEISQRLSVIEQDRGYSSPPIINDYDTVRKKKEEHVLKKVDTVLDEQLKIHKVNVENVMNVVNFVVDFVEVLVEYVPEIVSIVGGAFTGDFKLITAINLITKILTDAHSSFARLIDQSFLTDAVNHTVRLKFNQPKKGVIEATKTEVTTESIKKKSKKGCFFFRSGTSRRGKER